LGTSTDRLRSQRRETSFPESMRLQNPLRREPACSTVALLCKKMDFIALKVHPDAPAAAPSGSFSRARIVSPGDSARGWD
jgi:hypothetical protein